MDRLSSVASRFLSPGVLNIVRQYGSKPKRTPNPQRIQLEEKDLEENFIRTGGKGGQKINKTSICVHLRHIPTNIQVKCADSRIREENRRIGRLRLADKVDLHLNGEKSRIGVIAAKKRFNRQRQHQQAQKRHQDIAERKQQENRIEDNSGKRPSI